MYIIIYFVFPKASWHYAAFDHQTCQDRTSLKKLMKSPRCPGILVDIERFKIWRNTVMEQRMQCCICSCIITLQLSLHPRSSDPSIRNVRDRAKVKRTLVKREKTYPAYPNGLPLHARKKYRPPIVDRQNGKLNKANTVTGCSSEGIVKKGRA